ncbi:MAG: hydantoinase/oxoprolinase family protein, partial [Pseudomonadota bacterium]
DARSGAVHAFKTPSTPLDPSIGLIDGLAGAAQRYGFELSDVGLILHGSTIATNAVLERKLPRGALLTTAGFRDVLEIGRHMRKNVYALKAEPRPLLVPRHLRFEVRERIRASGEIETPLDSDALGELVPRLEQAEVEALAITFLHAYRNPAHELAAKQFLQDALPHITISTSHEVSPEVREFERTSTTVLNALLKPVISRYLGSVAERLSAAGIDATLYLVQSNGGVAAPDEAANLPAKLLLSGPAGGAMALGQLAEQHALSDLVGLDMGGTSSDVSVVMNAVIGETQESNIDGLPVRLPMIDIRTVGAGGGSIARADTGALRVGPQSAGAFPGPVCYQRGGEEPTVTDGNAMLGRINPESFLGGGMSLDVAHANTACREAIAEPLGMEAHAAAEGIVNVATSHMAGAIRLSLFEKGVDPIDFSLVPFGGAAGLHACAVATELGIDRIVFPAHASTLSARGMLFADLRHDLSRSELLIADSDALPRLTSLVDDLCHEARSRLDRDGIARSEQQIDISCDMRYRGQAYEITTPWPDAAKGTADGSLTSLNELLATFHTLHEQRFAHSSPDEPVEIVTVRAAAIGTLDKPEVALQDAAQSEAASSSTTRKVWLDGREIEMACVSRNTIHDPETINGPAMIEEEYTILLIEDGWRVSAMGNGDLNCVRQDREH